MMTNLQRHMQQMHKSEFKYMGSSESLYHSANL